MKVVYLLNRYGILCGQTVFGIQLSGIFAEALKHVGSCHFRYDMVHPLTFSAALWGFFNILYYTHVIFSGICASSVYIMSGLCIFWHPLDLVLLRAWIVWSGNRHVLKSIAVGYITALISVFAGVAKRETIFDGKSFVCGLWIETAEVIIRSGPCRRLVSSTCTRQVTSQNLYSPVEAPTDFSVSSLITYVDNRLRTMLSGSFILLAWCLRH